MTISEKLNHILPLVRKPARYIGGELHACRKDWHEADVRFALVFPDLYEIGMSHHGLQILYHILNAGSNTLADRCFCPDIDMESQHPLADFDVIGITLPYELCYTNILTVLDLAGIPFRANDRNGRHPLIIGGGSCGMHAEPVADFFDAIVLGDGEEAVAEIADVVSVVKRSGSDRQEMLDHLN